MYNRIVDWKYHLHVLFGSIWLVLMFFVPAPVDDWVGMIGKAFGFGLVASFLGLLLVIPYAFIIQTFAVIAEVIIPKKRKRSRLP